MSVGAAGHDETMWPDDQPSLAAAQRELGAADPQRWWPVSYGELRVGGCFVCFPRGHEGAGEAGDPAWAAAVSMPGGHRATGPDGATVSGVAGGAYEPGLLALREGPLLAAAVRELSTLPDVLLVNATGRDHPRRAGLALHLGAELGIPSVGVTHRSLLADGQWPEDRRGAVSPLTLADEDVGAWLRTRTGRRPVAVHAGWRTDVGVAVEVVRRCGGRHRTPAPLREARRLARSSRAQNVRPNMI